MTPLDGALGCLGCWCVAGLLWLASRIWYAYCMAREREEYLLDHGIISRVPETNPTSKEELIEKYAQLLRLGMAKSLGVEENNIIDALLRECIEDSTSITTDQFECPFCGDPLKDGTNGLECGFCDHWEEYR